MTNEQLGKLCAKDDARRANVAMRIERGSVPEPNTGCWLWTLFINQRGYGTVFGMYKRTMAHRASYEAFVGNIPAGMRVCHKCDTPACVNPQHLFLGTHQDNMDDMAAKGRRGSPSGMRSGMRKLDIEKVEAIKRMHSDGATLATIAMAVGCSPKHASAIARGFLWKATGTVSRRRWRKEVA